MRASVLLLPALPPIFPIVLYKRERHEREQAHRTVRVGRSPNLRGAPHQLATPPERWTVACCAPPPRPRAPCASGAVHTGCFHPTTAIDTEVRAGAGYRKWETYLTARCTKPGGRTISTAG